MKIVRSAIVLFLLVSLSACGWWNSEEQIEPAKLDSIKAERQVKTLWSTSVGQGVGEKYNALRPAILGNRIYVSDIAGNLSALELETGKTIWKIELDVEVGSAVGVGDGKVLVTTLDGELVAVKALDGSPLWRAKLSSEALAPAQANGKVVLVQTIDGRLTAYSPQAGEQLWSYISQSPALTLRGTSTPILTDKAAFAGFSNGKIVAIDIRNGNVAWESRVAAPEGKTELERIIDIDGSMLLSRDRLYVTSYQGRLVALSARDGRKFWKRPLSSYRGVAESLSQLFTIDAEGNVVSFEKSNGLEYWKQDGLFYRQTTTPAMLKNTVVVADFAGYVHFLGSEDGRFVARKNVDSSGIRGPLLSYNDVLYVFGNSGRLTALTIE